MHYYPDKNFDGIFSHECEEPGCTNIVMYDDEPACFWHSPDSGSSVKGYSARLKAEEIAAGKRPNGKYLEMRYHELEDGTIRFNIDICGIVKRESILTVSFDDLMGWIEQVGEALTDTKFGQTLQENTVSIPDGSEDIHD